MHISITYDVQYRKQIELAMTTQDGLMRQGIYIIYIVVYFKEHYSYQDASKSVDNSNHINT